MYILTYRFYLDYTSVILTIVFRSDSIIECHFHFQSANQCNNNMNRTVAQCHLFDLIHIRSFSLLSLYEEEKANRIPFYRTKCVHHFHFNTTLLYYN